MKGLVGLSMYKWTTYWKWLPNGTYGPYAFITPRSGGTVGIRTLNYRFRSWCANYPVTRKLQPNPNETGVIWFAVAASLRKIKNRFGEWFVTGPSIESFVLLDSTELVSNSVNCCNAVKEAMCHKITFISTNELFCKVLIWSFFVAFAIYVHQ